MDDIQRLAGDYPWVQTPLVVSAPMRLIALADMAVEVSKAVSGIGFIGAGTDVSDLESHVRHAQELLKSTTLQTRNGTLPIGIGFINWGANLEMAIPIIARHRPAAVWFFAPSSIISLVQWTEKSRTASPETKIWVQVGSVTEAVEVVKQVQPDVLVVQGTDAGGHGLVKGASIVTLLPEVKDTLEEYFQKTQTRQKPILIAAGGISDSRTFAAALTLGASGCILGTRLLATPEANITQGYRSAVLRTTDGGQSTVRTKVYDSLRGTNWAETHNARGIITQSYVDAVEKGMSQEENTRLYKEEMERGDEGWRQDGGRMTAYAGSGVGLVRKVMPVGDVIREVRDGVVGVLERVERRARI